jgi:hypothetical protein
MIIRLPWLGHKFSETIPWNRMESWSKGSTWDTRHNSMAYALLYSFLYLFIKHYSLIFLSMPGDKHISHSGNAHISHFITELID